MDFGENKYLLYDKDVILDFVILLSGYSPFLCKFNNNNNNNTKVFSKKTKASRKIHMDDSPHFSKQLLT